MRRNWTLLIVFCVTTVAGGASSSSSYNSAMCICKVINLSNLSRLSLVPVRSIWSLMTTIRRTIHTNCRISIRLLLCQVTTSVYRIYNETHMSTTICIRMTTEHACVMMQTSTALHHKRTQLGDQFGSTVCFI